MNMTLAATETGTPRDDVVVCILFFNKLGQTIECIRSFLSAGVAIHVFDNGSEPANRAALEQTFREFPQVRIEGEGRNLGVSGGRNRQITATSQPWLFFVDNDITASTPGWLESFAREARRVPKGEVFVPRMFNKHEDSWGHLANFVVDGCGNCSFVATESRFANSFPGGASLIHRRVFERCGTYDEDLFVGFEDFELAIRAWKLGSPILACSCDEIELIHDHRASDTVEDKASAKVRYDVSRITRSHRVIQEKHGLLLDPNFADWLDEQVRQVTGEVAAGAGTRTSSAFEFGEGGVTTPIQAGACSVLVMFLFGPDVTEDWLRLRSMALARDAARQAGVEVRVRGVPYAHGRGVTSDYRIEDAVELGLLDDILASDEVAEEGAWGSSEGYDLVFVAAAGFPGRESVLLAVQALNFLPQGGAMIFVPELRLVGACGEMRREVVEVKDPLLAGVAAGDLGWFAASHDHWCRIECGRYRTWAHDYRELLSCWLWEAARRGGAVRPLAGSEVVLPAGSILARGEASATWSVRHWIAQINQQEVLRHLAVGEVAWNALPLFVHRYSRSVPQETDALIRRHAVSGVSHLLLLPWLRRGGADLAALSYLRELGSRFPGRVVAITTEPVDSPWARHAAPGVEVVPWSRLGASGDRDRDLRALLELVYRARVGVVHVMNSMLGWQFLSAHGAQLRSVARVFASLFWYGPSPKRRLLGYAAEFLPAVRGKVDGIITDNEAFRHRLLRDYGWRLDQSWCVRHPTAWIADAPPPKRKAAGGQAVVLWASRLAPEKRIDRYSQ